MSEYDRVLKECVRVRQEGRRLGVGVACYVELIGVGPFEGATIRADSAGRITVFTGVPSQGQGLETTLAQVAADELGVTPDYVSIIGGDMLGIPQDIGTFASRAARRRRQRGGAGARAAREVRAARRAGAGDGGGRGTAARQGLRLSG
jgi:carbon-monoxide dehydrogenase large subunit